MNRLEIHKNSITHLSTDAVVNAANSSLVFGGGVCGVIFKAAGVGALTVECRKFGHCPAGSAVITSALGMRNNRYIIHAVGPVYQDGSHGEPQLLASCYTKALNLARDSGCHSIGFPLISAGSFGYPEAGAWTVALSACMQWLRANPAADMDVVFVHPERDAVNFGKGILALLLA